MSYRRNELLASVEWLCQHRTETDIVIIDCSRRSDAYVRAHIPNARCRPGHAYVKEFDGKGRRTAHVLGIESFAQMAAGLGISDHHTVVLYDDAGALWSSRLWWVFRYYGHTRVQVLNGGWQAWVESGFPVSTGDSAEEVSRGNWTPRIQRERIIDQKELRSVVAGGEVQIWDTRSREEYEGTCLRRNRRGGHIPGAPHLEWRSLLADAKEPGAVPRFLSSEDITHALAEIGLTPEQPTITYCQAGIRAAFCAFVLELMGHPLPRVYDASMAEWANSDGPPLAK